MSSSSSMSESRSQDTTYKGIRKRKWGKWVSEIRLPNCRERIWLGSYSTEEKAARAYDAALFCLRGPSAKFNFPDDPPRFQGVETLTQPEIAALAARYANGELEQSQAAPRNTAGEGSAEMTTLHQRDDIADQSSSSSPPPMVDWSYWDLMDGRESRVSDFSTVSRYDNLPGEFFPASDENCNEDFDDDVNHQHSFLWNF